MTFPRILSAAAAAFVAVSCFSCTAVNEKTPRISRYRDKEKEFEIGQAGVTISDHDVTEKDDDAVNNVHEEVRVLLNHLELPDNEENVQYDIDALLKMYNEIYDERTMAEVAFYGNYTNEHTRDIYNSYCRNTSVAGALISYGFYSGLQSSYASLFKDLVSSESLEQYSSGDYDINTARAEAESAFNDTSEDLNEYYDIVADESMSEDEKDLKCAEILLELFEEYTPESFYEQYDRDYTGEDIMSLSGFVKEKMIPAYNSLVDAYIDTLSWSEFGFDDYVCDDPFYVIREYSQQLSPDIRRSADRIINEKLYTIKNNDLAFSGAFTDELTSENSAYVFIGNVPQDRLLTTAIHEFGHFHASFNDDTPAFLIKDNIDLAEVHSQGFELLFTQFYDDIYGRNGDNMRLLTLVEMCDAVISGFIVGEFEYNVVSHIDELSPEDIVKLFNEAFSEYESLFHLYEISHIYESPGYYISYATSALASLEIFSDVINDKSAALDKYERIAEISCDSGEYTFQQALRKCGFGDVLSKEYISGTAAKLEGYAARLS